jgi:hypothetical protein
MARSSLWLMPCVVLLAGCLAANTKAESSNRTLNGNDWKLMTNEQRDGLVTGYFDCHVLGRQQVGPSGSRFEWASRITAYYLAARSHGSRRLGDGTAGPINRQACSI